MLTRTIALLLAVAGSLTLPAAVGAQGDVTPRPTPATLPSDDEIMRTIEEIVAMGPRRIGTPGGRYAVEYIAEKYRELGLTGVHIEETPAYSWENLRHDLTFAGQRIDNAPATYTQSPSATAVGTQSTPEGGLKTEIVDVGLATAAEVEAADVDGKIVMFDLKFLLPLAGFLPITEFLWDPEQTMLLSPKTMIGANPYITTFTEAVKAAQDAGAVGFVGVLSDYFNSNRYYNEFYRRLVMKIPGVWVTKAEGTRLRAMLDAHPGEQATLQFASRRAEVKGSAVVGFLQGKSHDTIMVQSHHDSGYMGAVEDASGVAEVLALAKHYGSQPADSREKSMMFVTFDTHWAGYRSHGAFAKRHIIERDPARDPHRIVANVTLEHIARAATVGDDGELELSDLPEPRGVFENVNPAIKTELIDAIVRNDLRRTAVLNTTAVHPVGIPTDAGIFPALGIATLSLIAGPVYLYDEADTLDKVLKGDLQDIAKAFAEVIDEIDLADPETLPFLPEKPTYEYGKSVVAGAAGYDTLTSTDRAPDPSFLRPGSRPGCAAAKSGRPVARARLVRRSGKRRLTFRVRRSGRLTITLRHRSGRVLRRKRTVVACRTYSFRVPRGVRSITIRGRGGAVSVRRRESRQP